MKDICSFIYIFDVLLGRIGVVLELDSGLLKESYFYLEFEMENLIRFI